VYAAEAGNKKKPQKGTKNHKVTRARWTEWAMIEEWIYGKQSASTRTFEKAASKGKTRPFGERVHP